MSTLVFYQWTKVDVTSSTSAGVSSGLAPDASKARPQAPLPGNEKPASTTKQTCQPMRKRSNLSQAGRRVLGAPGVWLAGHRGVGANHPTKPHI
jgi:hypothetical protein